MNGKRPAVRQQYSKRGGHEVRKDSGAWAPSALTAPTGCTARFATNAQLLRASRLMKTLERRW